MAKKLKNACAAVESEEDQKKEREESSEAATEETTATEPADGEPAEDPAAKYEIPADADSEEDSENAEEASTEAVPAEEDADMPAEDDTEDTAGDETETDDADVVDDDPVETDDTDDAEEPVEDMEDEDGDEIDEAEARPLPKPSKRDFFDPKTLCEARNMLDKYEPNTVGAVIKLLMESNPNDKLMIRLSPGHQECFIWDISRTVRMSDGVTYMDIVKGKVQQ